MGKEKTQQAAKKPVQRPLPHQDQVPIAELMPAHTGLQNPAQWGRLPNHATTHPIRRATILRMQQRQGNAFVQRMLKPIVSRQEETGEELEPIEPVPDVEGEGEKTKVKAYGGRSIRLHGRVDGQYNGGSFRTEDVTTERGSGCRSCGRGNPCVHVSGTLATDYDVPTTVTLPDVPAGLTPCQEERVRDFIDNVLAPHEQAHVDAMEQYNGNTSRPFDFTLCRSQFPAAIRRMVRQEEQPRRTAAQGASDALDPFNREVDLDCEDE